MATPEDATERLRAASNAGDGHASYELAMAYVYEIGTDGWEQRRGEVLALLAKAREQGFDSVDLGEPPGEEYLQFMERCAALHERYYSKHPEERPGGSSPGGTPEV